MASVMRGQLESLEEEADKLTRMLCTACKLIEDQKVSPEEAALLTAWWIGHQQTKGHES